jgi:phosphoglycolate phosphatase
MKILLFDIDGTLMRSGGASFRAMERAFAELFGVGGATRGVVPHGKTDPLILREILHRHHLLEGDDGAALAALQALYERFLPEEMPRAPAVLMPGVRELLAALQAAPDTLLGLLTGNFERGARVKLDRFGLNRYFAFGAFGSDDGDRNRLPAIAVARAEALLGRPLGLGPHVVVIGDTPRDVECALASGAAAVGVATGSYSVAELEAAGAAIAFRDLADTASVLAALAIPLPPARVRPGPGRP